MKDNVSRTEVVATVYRIYREIEELGSLLAMADGEVSMGQCWATTDHLVKNLHKAGISARAILAESEESGILHWAVELRDDAGQYVLDFTMGQFDESAPFPVVASTAAEWLSYFTDEQEEVSLSLHQPPV